MNDAHFDVLVLKQTVSSGATGSIAPTTFLAAVLLASIRPWLKS